MPVDLRSADVIIGAAGPNGGGVTVTTLNAAVADRAPASASYITRLAEPGLSNETALATLGTGLLKTTTGTGALSIATGADLPSHSHPGVVSGAGFLLDGGGTAITTGIKGDLPPMPFAGTITGYAILADQSGSITVQLWRDTLANYPPTSADLVLTMTLSANTRIPTSGAYQGVTAIAFSAGDVLRFNVSSAATVQRVTVGLRLERTI
jgi:hypothetical protein